MAWLLSKAEDLLNKVDQGAADTFNTSQSAGGSVPSTPGGQAKSSSWEHTAVSMVTESEMAQYRDTSLAGSAATYTRSTGGTGSPAPPAPLTKSPSLASLRSGKRDKDKDEVSSVRSAKRNTDEALFKFLNSPDTVEDRRSRHSRKSSISSTVSSRSHGLRDQQAGTAASESSATGGGWGTSTQQHATGRSPAPSFTSKPEEPAEQTETSSDYHSQGGGGEEGSSAALENKLLKSEISSLNQEMASVIKRAKDSQGELGRSARKVESLQAQLTTSDRIIRELRSREADLTEALHAKDSQLGVLKVRLDEADANLRVRERTVTSVTAERDRILQDHSSASGVQNHALDSVNDKLAAAEAKLTREQESHRQAQHEAMARQSALEEEKRSLAEALAHAQRTVANEKGLVAQLQQQLAHAKSHSETARQDLTDYKEKATRILQSKDRLITSLQSGGAGGGGGGEEVGGAVAIERDQLRHERELLREELQQHRALVDELRTDVQDLELQLQSDASAAQEQAQGLEEQLGDERRRREDAEAQLSSQAHELEYAQAELTRQQTALAGRVGEREAEIERLRAQLTNKSLSSSSQQELESRLRALTDNLIEKQTAFEAVSSEKNALRLQLDRLQSQYSELQMVSPKPSSVALDMDEGTSGVSRRLPSFMVESPADHEVTRRVKRAANNIDKFSIRLGVFLRRYPIARVFVILYMGLLHVWVMIVLLTYQPEMHNHLDNLPKPPGQ